MSDLSRPPVLTTPGHPWGDFLAARMRCLVWLRDEMGETPEKICRTMRMDPGQVRLILATADATYSGSNGEGP
jgi:hypothetical protein